MKIKLSKDWKWDSLEDRYYKNDIEISGLVVKEYMKDWGRPIHDVHILGVLDKFYDEIKV